MLGLAIYNGVLLDVHFPDVAYKKLLGEEPTFQVGAAGGIYGAKRVAKQCEGPEEPCSPPMGCLRVAGARVRPGPWGCLRFCLPPRFGAASRSAARDRMGRSSRCAAAAPPENCFPPAAPLG